MLTYKRIILLVALGIYFVLSFLFWNYSIDDAFITFRYAENFADGRGLVFNADDLPPVEGYSNFLWLLFLALIYKIGLPTYMTAKVVGLGLLLISGMIIFRRFENQSGYAWLGGPLFLICPYTALWGVSGLELGAHAFLIILALASLEEKSRRLFYLLPFLIINRPEGAIIACIMIISAMLSRRDNFAAHNWFFGKAFLISLATLAALTIFRLWYFDAPLPNTIYAKTQHIWWLGIRATYITLMTSLPLILLILMGIYFLARDGFRNMGLCLMGAVFAAQVIISALINPVMNFHWRYLIPVMPLAILLALSSLGHLKNSYLRAAAIVILVVTFIYPFDRVIYTVNLEQEIIKSQEAFLAWAEKAEPGATVTMTDMGRIPYYSDLKFNDLWGLINREIAREGYDLRRELERLPDYFVLVGYIHEGSASLRFGREAALAGSMAFYHTYDFLDICYPAGYNPRRPGYYYMIFQRRPYAAEILKQTYSGEPSRPIR